MHNESRSEEERVGLQINNICCVHYNDPMYNRLKRTFVFANWAPELTVAAWLSITYLLSENRATTVAVYNLKSIPLSGWGRDGQALDFLHSHRRLKEENSWIKLSVRMDLYSFSELSFMMTEGAKGNGMNHLTWKHTQVLISQVVRMRRIHQHLTWKRERARRCLAMRPSDSCWVFELKKSGHGGLSAKPAGVDVSIISRIPDEPPDSRWALALSHSSTVERPVVWLQSV